MKPDDVSPNWPKCLSVERVGACLFMLRQHGFVTESEHKKIHARVVRWAHTHIPYQEWLKKNKV
jgi:hypothetical protein